ncbi:MAG: divalent-cation tolerance protein CutA [Thermoplasmatota archaeon]
MARMLLVRTTVATEAQAHGLADRLVQSGLAACVHTGRIRSTYVWKGRQEDGDEWLVEARILPRHATAVRAALADGHPYEVPLVETVKVVVDAAYARWAAGKAQ